MGELPLLRAQWRFLSHAFTKFSLSLSPRPTFLTLPSLANASATLSSTLFSAIFIPSGSSEPNNVSLLLALSSWTRSPELVELLVAGDWEVLNTLSAILTRMQCVGLLSRFHRNPMYVPGTGVVMSAAVYRRLIGKIFAVEGAVRSDVLNGRTPLPFVVVHSGNTTIAWWGC